MLEVWKSNDPNDRNIYADLSAFCGVAGIECDPDELMKIFGVGANPSDRASETLCIQADGILWFASNFPEIKRQLPKWTIDLFVTCCLI